jgi:hypothetical protein
MWWHRRYIHIFVHSVHSLQSIVRIFLSTTIPTERSEQTVLTECELPSDTLDFRVCSTNGRTQRCRDPEDIQTEQSTAICIPPVLVLRNTLTWLLQTKRQTGQSKTRDGEFRVPCFYRKFATQWTQHTNTTGESRKIGDVA